MLLESLTVPLIKGPLYVFQVFDTQSHSKTERKEKK